MVFKSGKHSVNFVVKSTFKIRNINSRFKRFSVKFISVSVFMTWFLSTWADIINIVKVRHVVINIWHINTLRFSFEESFHSFLFKHMFIFLKFAWETFTFNLSKDWSFTSSFTSSKFSSEDTDGRKSIIVFFELLDEKLVSFTSGYEKLFKSSVNLILSSGDPFKMSVGVFNFSFDPFSMSSSLFSNFSVSIGNSSEVSDGFSSINLLLSPTSIVFSLFIPYRLLKF